MSEELQEWELLREAKYAMLGLKPTITDDPQSWPEVIRTLSKEYQVKPSGSAYYGLPDAKDKDFYLHKSDGALARALDLGFVHESLTAQEVLTYAGCIESLRREDVNLIFLLPVQYAAFTKATDYVAQSCLNERLLPLLRTKEARKIAFEVFDFLQRLNRLV
jgi:hypothetical protein